MSEWGLSDHRPKLVPVRKNVKKWRMSCTNERSVPKIKWEVLQDENKIEEYMDRMKVLLNEGEWDESVNEWKKVS